MSTSEDIEKKLENLIEKFRVEVKSLLNSEDYKLKMLITTKLSGYSSDEKLEVYRTEENKIDYAYFGNINMVVRKRGSE